MTREEYRTRIKSMIISALSISYDKNQVSNAQNYEQKSALILNTLLRDESLMNKVLENIELDSYEAAKADQKLDVPDVAIKYLSLVGIRDICYMTYDNLMNKEQSIPKR